MVGFSRRIAAVVAAGALAFGGTYVGMPVAGAQAGTETPLATAAPAPAGTIDPNTITTLNIHKLLGDPVPVTTTTPAAYPGGMTGLEGVDFKIEKLSTDLTTQAGWEQIAGMTATNLNGATVTSTKTITTDANGLATDSTLGVGVFRVTEIQKAGYTVAPAFLVTLPYSDPTTGNWNYTRDVYPKNQQVQPNKQVNDNQAQLGGTISYTINAPVPAGTMDRFSIKDPLVAELALKTGTVKVDGTGALAGTLVANTDYTVSETGNTVEVIFTPAGLTKLQNVRTADANLQVTVAFDATVNGIPASGTITNTATVSLPNGGTITTDVPIDGTNPSGPTSTSYGNLTITKTGTGATADQLAGAEFQVYLCQETSAGSGKYQLLGSPLNVATDTAGTTKTTTLTTDATATARAYGLPASSFAGGATGTVTNTYCALETKAPAGYVRDPEPRVLTYTPAAGAVGAFAVSINNVKESVIGQLPATGAWGIVLIFIIGGALLARGLYTSYKDNKQTA